MKRRQVAHLPFPDHWARRWLYYWVCDAWPVQRQTYTVTFLAIEHHRPLAGTNLHCLVNRGTCVCVNNLPKVVREMERPGLEPATYWLQLQCPNHYATMPHEFWWLAEKKLKPELGAEVPQFCCFPVRLCLLSSRCFRVKCFVLSFSHTCLCGISQGSNRLCHLSGLVFLSLSLYSFDSCGRLN